METQDLQRYELVQAFLSSVRNTQSRQEFMSRVQEFDSRFTDEQIGPAYSEKQKSVEKLPPLPQQKSKNPFKSNIDDSFRNQGAFSHIQPGQNSPFGQQANLPIRGNYNKTQQNFYKPLSGSAVKNDNYSHLGNNVGYGTVANQQNQSNYGGYGNNNNGGVGLLNYNAFSQREYDELKQQFFRPPNVPRQDSFMGNQRNDAFNFNQMSMGLGVSSSTDLLGPDLNAKPSGRGYAERVNPFIRP